MLRVLNNKRIDQHIFVYSRTYEPLLLKVGRSTLKAIFKLLAVQYSKLTSVMIRSHNQRLGVLIMRMSQLEYLLWHKTSGNYIILSIYR